MNVSYGDIGYADNGMPVVVVSGPHGPKAFRRCDLCGEILRPSKLALCPLMAPKCFHSLYCLAHWNVRAGGSPLTGPGSDASSDRVSAGEVERERAGLVRGYLA